LAISDDLSVNGRGFIHTSSENIIDIRPPLRTPSFQQGVHVGFFRDALKILTRSQTIHNIFSGDVAASPNYVYVGFFIGSTMKLTAPFAERGDLNCS